LQTLQAATQQPVRSLDLADDRLAALLRVLSDDTAWASFETALTRRLLRVYDLRAERVRLDSTSASGYWQVTPDGLFQLGHSKDHRPDLPQLKVMLATLDPLGLAVATDVLAGQSADDPAYVPSIERVRATLGVRGLLYVGDCKMAAVLTRAHIAGGQDRYLCPLSAVQVPPATLLALVQTCEAAGTPLQEVVRRTDRDELVIIAEGYEQRVALEAEVAGERVAWQERRLLVHSWAAAHAAETALHARMQRAQEVVRALPTRRRGKAALTSLAELEQAVLAVLTRQGVAGLLRVTSQEVVRCRQIRGYKGAPPRQVEERQLAVEVEVDEDALRERVRGLGWRVYATNAPATELSLEAAVLAYREEYLVERQFGRLKGQPLSLTPMYLERDDHAPGLVRLLSIGLRVLSLLEFSVRQRLQQTGETLAGVYAGNPKRATARPTAEGLLACFQEITLTVIQRANGVQRHLTPLTTLQQRILTLLDFAPTIYTQLVTHFSQPP
jgi:transposase